MSEIFNSGFMSSWMLMAKPPPFRYSTIHEINGVLNAQLHQFQWCISVTSTIPGLRRRFVWGQTLQLLEWIVTSHTFCMWFAFSLGALVAIQIEKSRCVRILFLHFTMCVDGAHLSWPKQNCKPLFLKIFVFDVLISIEQMSISGAQSIGHHTVRVPLSFYWL